VLSTTPQRPTYPKLFERIGRLKNFEVKLNVLTNPSNLSNIVSNIGVFRAKIAATSKVTETLIYAVKG